MTTGVGQLAVPEWVFREFGLPVESRRFRYEAMLYPEGRRKDQWGKGASVPDMSQLETRLWFFFLAASYLELGVEAIDQFHVGSRLIEGSKASRSLLLAPHARRVKRRCDRRCLDAVHWREFTATPACSVR